MISRKPEAQSTVRLIATGDRDLRGVQLDIDHITVLDARDALGDDLNDGRVLEVPFLGLGVRVIDPAFVTGAIKQDAAAGE